MSGAESTMPEASGDAWVALSGVDASTTVFPARAKCGEEWIIVVRTATGLHGIERACPHQKATMMEAVEMGGGAMLRCPRHNFVFRLADGRGVNCPGYALAVYAIRDEGGTLYARRK